MLKLNSKILKTFIRIQFLMKSGRNDIISLINAIGGQFFSSDEIELLVDEVLADGDEKNEEIIQKMLDMFQSYIITEYDGLNEDEDGMDEADRLIIEILESIGSL